MRTTMVGLRRRRLMIGLGGLGLRRRSWLLGRRRRRGGMRGVLVVGVNWSLFWSYQCSLFW